jgi:CheY-like chemotaxis protein
MIQSIPQVEPDRLELLGYTESILWSPKMPPDCTPRSENNPANKKKATIQGKQPKILVVDDHEAVRRALSKLLIRGGGWEPCGEAATAAEAIEKARHLRPDIVLLDITLPDFSGFEVAAVIQKELPDCKILIVSQHEPAQMLSKAQELGARGYVTKAKLSTDLLPAIRALLGKPT